MKKNIIKNKVLKIIMNCKKFLDSVSFILFKKNKFILLLPVIFFVLSIGTNNLFSAEVTKYTGETTIIKWSSTDIRSGTCQYTSSPSQYPGWMTTGDPAPDANLDPGISLLLTQTGTYDIGVKCRGLDNGVDPLGEWVFDTVRLVILDGDDGFCGTAHGSTTMQSIPSTVEELCTNGTASAVSGSGKPWSWTCNGINGGSNASCSVYKLVIPTPSVNITPNTAQTITLGDFINFTSRATSTGNYINEHHIDIQYPDGSWDYNVSEVAALGGVASNITSFKFNATTTGTYRIQAAVQNVGTTTWILTNLIEIVVNEPEVNNERPVVSISTSDLTGENQIVLGASINILSRASSTDISNDITRHHIDYLPPGKDESKQSDWVNNASGSIAFTNTGLHNTTYTFKPSYQGVWTVKASACDDEAKGTCRWTDSEYIIVEVLPGPQPGVCGSSDGGEFEDITDITDRCDLGTTPSPIVGSAPNWLWTCGGIYGSPVTAACSARLASIEGIPIAEPETPEEIVYFASGEEITEADQEFLCITGRVEEIVWHDDGDYWTWKCVGNGPTPVYVPGIAHVPPAPVLPSISFKGTPTSISKGTVIVLSWEIKNPNGFCRIRAKSASLSAENVLEITRINKFLSRNYTDERDPAGKRRISKALTMSHPKFNNMAVGRVSVKVNYPTEFQLSCSRGGADAKRVKINIAASNEG